MSQMTYFHRTWKSNLLYRVLWLSRSAFRSRFQSLWRYSGSLRFYRWIMEESICRLHVFTIYWRYFHYILWEYFKADLCAPFGAEKHSGLSESSRSLLWLVIIIHYELNCSLRLTTLKMLFQLESRTKMCICLCIYFQYILNPAK